MREVALCDVCRSEENVRDLTILNGYGMSEPWTIDLCNRCFQERFSDLLELGRVARVNRLRPQRRASKIEIDESNL